MTNVKSFIVGIIVIVLLAAGGAYVYQKSIRPAFLDQTPTTTPSPSSKFKTEATPSAIPGTQTTQKTNITSAPSTGNDPENIGINISQPIQGGQITQPTQITGSANVLDSTVNIQIKDANGNILGSAKSTACMAKDACQFSTTIFFTPSSTSTGTIEAFGTSTFANPKPYLQIVNISF